MFLILKKSKSFDKPILNCLKLKDLLENPISCLSQKIRIQNLLLLICSLKKDFFSKPSFLFLLINFMNRILMVNLSKKLLIKWVICRWLLMLILLIIILTMLKLLIFLLLVWRQRESLPSFCNGLGTRNIASSRGRTFFILLLEYGFGVLGRC